MIKQLCENCKNYTGNLSCLAFDLIPSNILLGKNNHNKPLKDQDNDLIYEPLTD